MWKRKKKLLIIKYCAAILWCIFKFILKRPYYLPFIPIGICLFFEDFVFGDESGNVEDCRITSSLLRIYRIFLPFKYHITLNYLDYNEGFDELDIRPYEKVKIKKTTENLWKLLELEMEAFNINVIKLKQRTKWGE